MNRAQRENVLGMVRRKGFGGDFPGIGWGWLWGRGKGEECAWQGGVWGLNGVETMMLPLNHPLWLIFVFLLGACVGSFLNVVIYRLPLGMSVNEPRRSFCPSCRKMIPVWLNFPVLSWLWLRGRCRECGVWIPVRYVVVEGLTGLLFLGVWWCYGGELPMGVVVVMWVVVSLAVAVAFIDAGHLIIPVGLTWAGTVSGLVVAWWSPEVVAMGGDVGGRWEGLLRGGLGWLVGFLGLGLVVELGKLAFGRKVMRFDGPVAWCLREPERADETLSFVIGEEVISWWDLFNRPGDRLVVDATEVVVDGEAVGAGELCIREAEVVLPGGRVVALADLKSLSGQAVGAVIPREAMGRGDLHVLGMVGAWFGWGGVLFTVFSSSVIALLAALAGRVGFGRQLPFGPFLLIGAGIWMFGGWRLFAWYWEFLQPLR